MEEITRILIVGFGSIGKRHLEIGRKLLPNAEIFVLRSSDNTNIPEHANGCFTNLSEALVFSPELAVISNPSNIHLNVAIPLAQIGCHLLIEKPLSNNLEATDELIKIANEKKGKISVGYNLRYLKSLQYFRDLLFECKIGRVLSARCEVGQYLPDWRPGYDYRRSVSANKELGGGVLLELSHEIDYLLWIFGEIDWVFSNLSKQSHLEIDIEDTVHVIMGFKNSEIQNDLIASLNMDFIRRDLTRKCTVIGEYGTLRWNGITGVVDYFDVDTNNWIELYKDNNTRNDSYIAEWKNLLESIKFNHDPMISVYDGIKVLKVVTAIRKSSKEKCRINLHN